MEQNAKKKTTDDKDDRRPAFNYIDWIIAAFSIALMAFILVNLPAF